MFRLLVVIIVVAVLASVVVLGATGVLRVYNTNDSIKVELQKNELKQKAENAVRETEQAGSRLLEKTGKALRHAGGKLEREGAEHQPASPTPSGT